MVFVGLIIGILLIDILLIWFNVVDDVMRVLQLNSLLIFLISGKIIYEFFGYYKLKKVELYNLLYKQVREYLFEMERIIDSINGENILKFSQGKIDYNSELYLGVVRDVYKVLDILSLIHLVKVNVDNAIIIDINTKEVYIKYVVNMIKMRFKEKNLLKGGTWASKELKNIICSNCPYKNIIENMLGLDC